MSAVSRIDFNPGDHPCDRPVLPEEAAQALYRNSGEAKWRCDVCGSRWAGGSQCGYRRNNWEYWVAWRRRSPSGWVWKRRERKRIADLTAVSR